MTRLTLARQSTVVDFPAEWTKTTFADLQATVLAEDDARVAALMCVALLVRYIHDNFFKTKDNKKPPRLGETGHDTFEEWCESIDRTKQWGHYLVKAAEHAARVDNPRQARELAGLKGDEADAVVEAAEETGAVTTQTLAEARAATVKSNRAAAKQIDEAQKIRAIRRALTKAKNAGEKHGGMPEKFFTDVERWLTYCDQQLELAAA